MVEMRMTADDDNYPKNYFYLMGHAFGEDGQYSIEPLGRFGTPTEAEAHIDIINEDIKKEKGILANDDEFPFLIMEVVNITVDKDDEGTAVFDKGETVNFFIYDWSHEGYTNIGEVSRIDCLGEYQDRILQLIKNRKAEWAQYDSTVTDETLNALRE